MTNNLIINLVQLGAAIGMVIVVIEMLILTYKTLKSNSWKYSLLYFPETFLLFFACVYSRAMSRSPEMFLFEDAALNPYFLGYYLILSGILLKWFIIRAKRKACEDDEKEDLAMDACSCIG